MENLTSSDIKQKLTTLSNPSTSVEGKKSIVEFLVTVGIKTHDFVEIIKQNDGILILTTLFKNVNDFDVKAKVTSLLNFLSLSGRSGPDSEKLMSEINTLSLINFFAEKDFHVFMQAFSGLKILGEPKSSSSKSSLSFNLPTATLFLENISTLIDSSSKLLPDSQKMELLGSFTQFVLSGAIAQAAADAAKNSDSAPGKNFNLAYQKFVRNLESCHKGDFSLLDMVVAQILQMIKEGRLINASPPNDYLDIVNKWLGGSRKFNLLYNTSKDGKFLSTFHQKCDNKGATVTVITSSEGYVFGGFVVMPWTCEGKWAVDTSMQSFLFSLKNPRNAPPAKFPLINSTNTNYCHTTYGPTFGTACDIYTGNGSEIGSGTVSTNLSNSSYSNSSGLSSTTVFTGQSQYILKELEVYQVV